MADVKWSWWEGLIFSATQEHVVKLPLVFSGYEVCIRLDILKRKKKKRKRDHIRTMAAWHTSSIFLFKLFKRGKCSVGRTPCCCMMFPAACTLKSMQWKIDWKLIVAVAQEVARAVCCSQGCQFNPPPLPVYMSKFPWPAPCAVARCWVCTWMSSEDLMKCFGEAV